MANYSWFERAVDSGSETDNELEERIQDRFPDTISRKSSGRSSSVTIRSESRLSIHRSQQMDQQQQEIPQSRSEERQQCQEAVVRSDRPLQEDSFVNRCRGELRANPKPYDAREIQQLVQTLLHLKHAPQSRLPSSREVEQPRAGSSANAVYTPMLNNIEPEVILHDDSPKDLPASSISSQKSQSLQQDQEQSLSQSFQPREKQLKFVNIGIQTSQLFEFEQQMPELAASTNTYREANRENKQHKIRRNPSPIQSASPNFQQQQQQYADWESKLPKRKTITDYPPSCDYNNIRFPVVPPLLDNNYKRAPNEQNYRKIYIDNLMKDLGEKQLSIEKMRAKTARFGKQRNQELTEWELESRERELEMRRKRFEEKKGQHMEDVKKWHSQILMDDTGKFQSEIPIQKSQEPASILKKSSITNNRVAFSSPIPDSSSFSDVEKQQSRRFNNIDLENQKNTENVATNIKNSHHHQQSHRNALSNRTNQLRTSTSFSSSALSDVHSERAKEGNRMDYLNKWQCNQEVLKSAKRQNPRMNLRSNPTSIFQPVSHHTLNPSAAEK